MSDHELNIAILVIVSITLFIFLVVLMWKWWYHQGEKNSKTSYYMTDKKLFSGYTSA